MAKKAELTKITALEQAVKIIAAVNKDDVHSELIDKLERMHEQERKVAENKKGKKGKPSKTAQEKAKRATQVAEWFETQADKETFYGGSDIATAVGLVDEKGLPFTPQKMTPILKVLVESGVVEKGQTSEKKVGYKVK